MTENVSEIKQQRTNPATKFRWELVPKEDYPLLMLEYTRLLCEENAKMQDQILITMSKVIKIQSTVTAIQNWVVFLGVLFGSIAVIFVLYSLFG